MKKKQIKSKSKRESSTPYLHSKKQSNRSKIIENFSKPVEQETFKDLSLSENNKEKFSILVFRLGDDWFALPTLFFKEVLVCRPVHSIPHRRHKIFLGVVNLNGELKLYVALGQILGLKSLISLKLDPISYQQERMIAIEKEGELWVFSVNEIDGIYNLDLAVDDTTSTHLSNSTVDYVKKRIKIEDKKIRLLDEDLLFSSLKRSI